MKRTLQVLAIIGAIAVWPAVAGATEPTGEQTSTSAMQLAVPHTPQEHLARADYYKKKAAEYRAEADAHRKMLEDYHKKHPDIPWLDGEGQELPPPHGTEIAMVTKERKHCAEYISALNQVTEEADRFAEFHRMSAEEMRGK